MMTSEELQVRGKEKFNGGQQEGRGEEKWQQREIRV